jgi:hypothetical protein
MMTRNRISAVVLLLVGMDFPATKNIAKELANFAPYSLLIFVLGFSLLEINE